MFFRFVRFSFLEALTSLWRSRMLNALSIGTIMFAMFILGSFIFVGMNLKAITVEWQEQIQFNVFLKDEVADSEVQQIAAYLENHLLVDQVIFLSKEQARDKFQKDFRAYAEVVEAVEENPFPASFQVFLVKGAGGDTFQDLKQNLDNYPGIEAIYYDEEIFRRLAFFANLIQLAGWFFGGIMIFSSVFTISNVLKLTFFTRREEVDIMKLVGASRAYIRGPFVIEGILIGFLGAICGVVLVYSGFLGLTAYLNNKPDFLLGHLQIQFLSFRWVMFLILAGGLSGLVGSLISLHQFLEEHIRYQ